MSESQGFTFPFGTAILEDGTTFLTETFRHRVKAVAFDGTEIFAVGGRGNMPGNFDSPRGICAVGREMIAVADTGNARVQLLRASTGKPIRTLSGGQLRRPWDVAWSPDTGHLFVVDMKLSTVLVFTEKGDLVHRFTPSCFQKPNRVEYHSLSGKVRIADSLGTHIQIVNEEDMSLS